MSRFTLTAGHAADIMTNAIEAGHYGIGYWCSEATYKDEDLRDKVAETDGSGFPVYALPQYWEEGGAMILQDAESDDQWEINLAKLREALENENLPHDRAARILEGEGADDAEDADVIIQVAIFNEIVFG